MVLSDPVELAHALSPTNDSERLLFRELMETLVRLDCQGRVHPGLAESWEADSEPGGWTFTLREGARSPGGTRVTPLLVASALTGPEAKALGIDSAVELDQRRVRVRVRATRDTAPRILADPALAVLDGLASTSDPVRRFHIPSREGRPPIEFQVAENGDPRDAIDRGVDLAVTRDPAVGEYVAGRPQFVTYPLPWSRTYVLLQPAGARVIDVGAGEDSLRRSLARDAVHTEARPAELPFWSDSLQSCPTGSPAQSSVAVTARVVYPRGDEAARGLAERMVALSGDARLTAAPLTRPDFMTAIQQGSERAYIIPLPRHTLSPCREAAGWPAAATIRPLIDTRARAIIRRGAPPLTVDWDGTVTLEAPPGGSR